MVFHTKKGMSYLERFVIIRKVCVVYTLVPCAVVTSDWVIRVLLVLDPIRSYYSAGYQGIYNM